MRRRTKRGETECERCDLLNTGPVKLRRLVGCEMRLCRGCWENITEILDVEKTGGRPRIKT